MTERLSDDGATPAIESVQTSSLSASLERRLPLMISALLAITLGAFGLLAFNEVRQSSAASALSQLSTLLKQSVDNSGRGMASRMDAIEKQASTTAIGAILAPFPSAADSSSARSFLMSKRVPSDSLSLLAQVVLDANGQQRLTVGRPTNAIANDVLARTIADAVNRDSASISPFFASDSELHYWVVARSRTASAPGFVAEHRRLPPLSGLDSTLRALTGQEFALYFANRSGDLWAGTPGRLLAPQFDISERPDSFKVIRDDSLRISAPVTGAASSTPVSKPRATAPLDSFNVVASNGSRMLGVKGNISGTQWVLILAATEEAVNHRSMLFLRRMLFIGAALLVIAILGAWWISRRVTRPLKSLTQAASAIADGDFARRERASSPDELGQLARAFNTMAERVGLSHTQLGSRIRESEALAAELNDRNEELQLAQRLATDARNASDRARADAQRANHAKTEFLAMMSHELRTPLSAIAGYAEIMQLGMHGDLNDKQRGHLERIQANQVHLLRIINDILDLTQVESGQMTVDLQPVALRDVVADLEPIIRPHVDGRNIHYEVTPAVLALSAKAERERLTQILVNLVANASRFTEAGGSITVSAETEDGRIRIHVTDTGKGIPADKQEVIFQPFVQLDGGPSRQTQGTGLGLAISRRIAEAMGGTLRVASTLGKGSTFTLELASAPGARDSNAAEPGPEGPNATPRRSHATVSR